MSRDIILRLILSFIIILLIFALHRAITVGPRTLLAPLATERPLLFAHRGGSALAPENTLVAFRNAANLGADALELDVRLTADDELVVFHDETVERTTGGTGAVREKTLAHMRELDAGYHFTTDGGDSYPFRGQGVGISTIGEIFAAFPDHLINIDIKDQSPLAVAKLAAEIAAAGAANRVIVASFYDDNLSRFRTLAPGIATAAGPGETRTFYILSQLGLRRFHRPLGDVYQVPTQSGRFRLDTANFIANAARNNQKVHYWTIDDPAEMRRLLELGADGIMTDRPDLALLVFQEMGYK